MTLTSHFQYCASKFFVVVLSSTGPVTRASTRRRRSAAEATEQQSPITESSASASDTSTSATRITRARTRAARAKEVEKSGLTTGNHSVSTRAKGRSRKRSHRAATRDIAEDNHQDNQLTLAVPSSSSSSATASPSQSRGLQPTAKRRRKRISLSSQQHAPSSSSVAPSQEEGEDPPSSIKENERGKRSRKQRSQNQTPNTLNNPRHPPQRQEQGQEQEQESPPRQEQHQSPRERFDLFYDDYRPQFENSDVDSEEEIEEELRRQQQQQQQLQGQEQDARQDRTMGTPSERMHNIFESFMSSMGMGGHRLSNEKVDALIQDIKNDDDMGKQYDAVTELCNFFSMSSEHAVANVRIEQIVPELARLLRKDHNIELVMITMRTISNLLDVMPSATSLIISNEIVPILTEKLLNVEFIDLAEMAIQCMEPLSIHHSSALLRDGVLAAILTFVDFFGITLQRKILGIVSNMCMRIPSSQFELVESVLPNLSNFLQYDDKVIIETTVLCFSRIASCFADDNAKLIKITERGLLDKALSLLTNPATNDKTMSHTLDLLASLSRSSHLITQKLYENNVCEVLEDLLTVMSDKTASEQLGTPLAGGTANSKDVHIKEIVALIAQLIPRMSPDSSLITELPPSKFSSLLQDMVIPEEYAEKVSKNTSPAYVALLHRRQKDKIRLFQEQPALLLQFGKLLFPPLMTVHSQSHSASIRNKCLTIIGTCVHYSPTDTLREMLLSIPISTFLTNLLHSRDMVTLAGAIHIGRYLMVKLPEVLGMYFVREGFVHGITKISGRTPGSKTEFMLDIMKKRAIKKYKRAEELQKTKTEALKKTLERRALNEAKKKSEQQQSLSDDNDDDESISREKQPLDNPEDDDEEITEFRLKKTASNSLPKEVHVPFEKPQIKPPTVPEKSSLSNVKVDHSSLSSLALIDYVIVQAQELQRDFFDEDLRTSKNTSTIVTTLHGLSKDLQRFTIYPDEEEENNILKRIRDIFSDEDGVTNFEVLNSDVIPSILEYLTCIPNDSASPATTREEEKQSEKCDVLDEMDDFDMNDDNAQNDVFTTEEKHLHRIRRVTHFCKIFNVKFDIGERQRGGSFGGGSFSRSYSGSYGSPSRLGSPHRKSFGASHEYTYLLEFVRKLQECLSSCENFPLLVNDAQPTSGVTSLLSRPFRIKLELLDSDSDLPKEDMQILMTPLARTGALSEYLAEYVSSRPSHRRTEEEREETADRNNDNEDDDDVADDDDVDDDEGDNDDMESRDGITLTRLQDISATRYFDMDDMSDDDDEGNVSNQVMVNADTTNNQTAEGTASSSASQQQSSQPVSKYAFLDREKRNEEEENPKTKTQRHFTMWLNGHQLDPNVSIYQSLYMYGQEEPSDGKSITGGTQSDTSRLATRFPKHPSNSRLWDSARTIKYKQVTEEEEQENERVDKIGEKKREESLKEKDTASSDQSSATSTRKYHQLLNSELLCTPNAIFNIDEALDKKYTDTFHNVDQDCLHIIELLNILQVLSVNAHRLLHPRGLLHSKHTSEVTDMVPNNEFRNSKITTKVQRQLRDTMVLFSGCMPEWCFQLSSQCQWLIPFETRREYFELSSYGVARALQRLQGKTGQHVRSGESRVDRIVRIEKKKVILSRDKILENAFFIMECHGDTRQLLEFEFRDEVGTGLGPTLEFYTLVSKELQMAELDIWRDDSTMDERKQLGHLVRCQRGLFPRPIANASDKSFRIFHFVGKFLARAMYDGRLIDMPLSTPLLKALRGDALEYYDLELIDTELFKQLGKLHELVQQKQAIEKNSDLSETEKKEKIDSLKLDDEVAIKDLCLSFTLPGYETIELEKGGADCDVTIWNLERYCDLIIKFTILEGISKQMDALRRGFDSLVPVKNLRLFTVREMEDVICGCDEEWNEQLLIESTKCDHGYSHNSQTTQFLFQVLSGMSKQERRDFLRFCTGSPRLPFGGLANLSPRLTIVRKTLENSEESPDQYLPSVMTCQNYLKLPEYSNVVVMRKQLMKAISLGQDSFLLS